MTSKNSGFSKNALQDEGIYKEEILGLATIRKGMFTVIIYLDDANIFTRLIDACPIEIIG